jgi:hypothetical protein
MSDCPAPLTLDVLKWAADNQRLVVTHDVSTMSWHAHQRIERGESMPGVIETPERLAVRQALVDLTLLAVASLQAEWEGQVLYLPLR